MSAHENLDLFNQYESDLADLRRRQVKMTNFYENRQYSTNDRKRFRQMGLKPIVVNVVRPLIGQQLAILTSSKPTWKIVPLQGASKEIADILQRFLVGKWNADYLDIQLELALKDMLVTGAGYLFIDIANFLDNATFDLKVERVNWKYVYPDPKASRFDMSDAENILVRKKVGLKYAQAIYRLTEAEVRQAVVDANVWTKADVIDRFSKFPVEQVSYEVRHDEHNNLHVLQYDKMPPSVFYTSRLKNKVENEKKKWLKELQELESEGKINLTKLKKLNIYRCLSVGDYTVYEGIMNIKDYPIIPFTDEFTDEVDRVNGEAFFLEGIQESINKFYMLLIHNAMLTGNVRFIGPKDAVVNKTQFQKTSTLPGAYLDWVPQPDLPNFGKPEMIQPGQLSSAFYTLGQDLQQKAEYQTSIFAPVRGDPRGSPETFSTTATLQNYAGQRIGRLARRIEIMMSKAAEVMIQYIQNYTDENELLQYIDDRPYIEEGTNPTFGTMQDAGRLNELITKDDVIKEIKNDARIGQYAVKALTQPNLGTDRLNKAAFLTNMIMNKAMPALPSVMKKLFDLMEVPGYQEIIAEFTQNQALAPKFQQLVKALQQMQKMNVALTKEADKLKDDNDRLEMRAAIQRELKKIHDEISGTAGGFDQAVNSILEGVKGNGQGT